MVSLTYYVSLSQHHKKHTYFISPASMMPE